MRKGLTEDLYTHVESYRDRDEYSEREKLAIEFAERFALAHREIDDELFVRLRGAYSDTEIVELAGTVAFSMGFGRINAVLDIANDCAVRID